MSLGSCLFFDRLMILAIRVRETIYARQKYRPVICLILLPEKVRVFPPL